MATELLPSILASTSFLSPILVPLTGLVFPAVAMAALFVYIESEDIA